MAISAEDYPAVISGRMSDERVSIAASWLGRLRALLTVPAGDVFPSEQLLDHIPSLVNEIARYLAAPGDAEIAANAAVMDKARELGQLRHAQHASAHQLLHEYEILGEILETFLVEETERLQPQPSVDRVLRRAPPSDARGAGADADDGRHLHRGIHRDDSGTERAVESLQSRRQPRAALADRHAAIRRAPCSTTKPFVTTHRAWRRWRRRSRPARIGSPG